MSKEAESSYRDLVKQHGKFLRRNPDATDQDRRRPLQFIETPGIECGLWPTLYWCTEMCETVERATDARRLKRLGQAVVLNDDSDEENPGERHSIKRSFMRKVLSPIIGYSQDFELLQFVYDLTLWSRIGGGKKRMRRHAFEVSLEGRDVQPPLLENKASSTH